MQWETTQGLRLTSKEAVVGDRADPLVPERSPQAHGVSATPSQQRLKRSDRSLSLKWSSSKRCIRPLDPAAECEQCPFTGSSEHHLKGWDGRITSIATAQGTSAFGNSPVACERLRWVASGRSAWVDFLPVRFRLADASKQPKLRGQRATQSKPGKACFLPLGTADLQPDRWFAVQPLPERRILACSSFPA